MIKSVSSNSIQIAISILPIYPAAIIDSFPDADVWTGAALETADAVKTPDGNVLKWGKNSMIERTLTVSPVSKIGRALEYAVIGQQRKGDAVMEPFNITVIVTDLNSGRVDTYADGVLINGELGMGVGQDRLQNRAYNFKFGEVLSV